MRCASYARYASCVPEKNGKQKNSSVGWMILLRMRYFWHPETTHLYRMGISCSCADALLAQAKLERFAAEMCRVAEQCFTYNTIDDWSDTVLTYIFQGGVYGSADNQIAVEQSKSNGTVGYALKRFFLPYRSMTVQYPILKKAPILLPFCWGARGFGAVFGGKSHRIAAELSIANQLSDERIDEIQALCTRLGL